MSEPTKTQVLLGEIPPDSYIREWTERIAVEKQQGPSLQTSVTVFRCGGETFALQTGVIRTISEPAPIHRIPHLKGKTLLGLVNILGELELCCSLTELLSLPADEESAQLVVLGIRAEDGSIESWVFPVDKVLGFHYLQPDEIRPVPDTLAGPGRFSRGIFRFAEATEDNGTTTPEAQGQPVNLLDHNLVAAQLRRSLK